MLGYVVRGPLAGFAWHHLQYVLGLAALGHEVFFFEDSGDYAACYDPVRQVTDEDPTYGLNFTAKCFARFGLGDMWSFHDAHNGKWYGPVADTAVSLGRSADLVLNVSGVNPIREWCMDVPKRILVDTDPVFTQIRNLTNAEDRALAEQHTDFFTFGEKFADADCEMPQDGYHWQPTRQPIFLPAWPVTGGNAHGAYTTVMQWDSYSHRDYGDRHYGMKSESFAPYMEVPRLSGEDLELALGSANAPRDTLSSAGWLLRNPLEVTSDPWRYQEYIASSKGEFGVAKHGYVVSRSGWFSERTACYLASGRPAVVQDTGFSDWLTTDAGVMPFTGVEEAVANLAAVNRNYDHHCRQARAVAEQYFDSNRVLKDLIDRTYSTS